MTLYFGVSFRRAVATSLAIISLIGAVALGSHLAEGVAIDLPVTLLLACSTATGALIGTLTSPRLPQRLLGRCFAVVVSATALFLLADVLLLDGPPGG